MRYRILLFLLLLLPAWAARAQAPNWQTVLGNSATVIRGSAANASGDYYVVGTYNGTLALGGTAASLTSTGGEDMFLAKFSGSTNAFVWAVSGGGATGNEDGRAVAVNGSNVYVTGSYDGAASISGSSLTAATGVFQDMFVAKYVDNGTTVTPGGALSGGGGGSDAGFSIAVSGTNVYVAGYMSTNATTPVISGTALTGNGSQDMFVARFTDTGSLANGSAVSGGGGGLDRALVVGVNSNGVYVTGFLSANATAPVIQGAAAPNAGGQDMYVAKYTATLGNAGVVFGGSSGNDQGQALTISGNNIYVAGIFNGTASIAGASLTSAGVADVFVAKYTDSGSGLTNGFAVRDGGSNTEAAGDIAVTGTTVYLVGNYNSATSFSGSSLTSIAAGGTDAFVAKYTDLGSSLGNLGAIEGGSNGGANTNALTVSTSGPQVLVAGGDSAPATFGSIAVASGTAYVAKLAPASTTLTSIVLGGSNPTNAASVTYTVTFGSTITGLSTANFSLTSTGAVAGASITGVTGSGTTYTVTVNTGTGDGTLRLNLANDTGLSLAISNRPYTSGPAYTIDKTSPTTTITSATAANGGSTSTSPIAYTVTFSEAVTGFVAGDVTVGNGAISGFSGSGTTYTFNVTPAANGAVTVNVLANVAQDAATNGNTAASTYTITYSQPVTAAPVVTLPANGSFLNTTTPTYSGTAAPNSTVTVYVDGTALATTTTATAGGTFALTQPTALAQGSHTVKATAQTSGSAVSANSNTNTFTVDSVPPTVAITSSAGASGSTTSTSPIPFTVTFSESVAGFVSGDVSVTNGMVSGFSGSGTTYTFSVTPTIPGTVTVNVPANGATDAAGNGNTAAPQFTITYNLLVTAAPVVTSPANGSLLNTATPTYSGTAPAGSNVVVQVDGAVVGSTTAPGGTWSVVQSPGLPDGPHSVRATAQLTGQSVSLFSNSNAFTVDTTPPTVSISSTAGASGSTTSTSPIPFTITFSESVTGFASTKVTVTNGTVSGFSGSGTTYTFNVTPTANGAVTVNVAANQAQDAAGNGNTAASTYTITYTAPTATVASVTRSTPSPTATATVAYQVTFSAAVTGVTTSNFSLTTTGAVAGASVTSVSGSGTTYTVTVNTGTGDGTLRLDVANNTGLSPTVSNTPFTGGEVYTITKSFAAAPQLTIRGTGGAGSDVTAFVDVVQVLSGGLPFANALQNGSFETHDPLANGNYGYNPTGSSWTFSASSGIAENGSAFGPAPAPSGIAVAFFQNSTSVIAQNLAVPTGSYQVNFQTSQRGCCSTGDQALNVFLNGVFVGSIQPLSTSSYSSFTSATFSVTAPALTATISSTAGASGSATSTAPIPFSVTFSQPVGTSFTASDVTVGNGTLSGFAGSGSGPYTFNVTPTANGTVTVNVPANVAQDANNTGNTAASTYTITYTAPITATTWTGVVSTDWFLAGNWSAGVPTTTLDATIPAAAPNMPLIAAGTATTKALTLNAGATLTQTGGTLDVRADLTNNGSLSATGGTVVLGSTALANILGSSSTRFFNLTAGPSGAQSGTAASTSVQRLLTLNGNFSTLGNPLTLESNATATALVVNNAGNAIVGNVAVQRYIAPDLNPGLGYRHYSSPVSTTTVGSLATGSFTPVVNPNYNTSATPSAETPFPTVYFYDQARLATATNNLAAFDKGWTSPGALSDPLTVGKGYTVNLAANQTLSVTGPQNNGNVPLTLNRNATGSANAFDAGWQLVGNPYPSPLDYSLVAPADRTNLDAAIFVFESISQYAGTYRANVNGVGGNANSPNAVLALGQGFFVRVSSGQTSGTLTLRNGQRLTAYTNPVYHRPAETRPLVQLDLQGAGKSDPLYVYFQTGATTGFDSELDAAKLPNSTGLNLSAEAAGQRLAINGLPTLGTVTVTVPLTVGVPAAGAFSFNVAQLLNLSTTPVYLRDRQTGAVVDLARQPSYSFVVSNASALITGRFELVFSPQAVLATAPAALAAQVGLYPNPAKSAAFVELPAALGRTAVAAALVDALGRTVRTQTLPAQGAAAHRLSLAELATGVYTLHLATTAGVLVRKLVIE